MLHEMAIIIVKLCQPAKENLVERCIFTLDSNINAVYLPEDREHLNEPWANQLINLANSTKVVKYQTF